MKKILRDNDAIKELMPKAVSRNTQNMNLLPLVVLVSHMMGLEEIKDPAFQENLHFILKLAPQLTSMMMEVAMDLNQANRAGQSPKRMAAKNFVSILEISQHII